MQDKNGIEMATGMVVKIEGAYFKCDNGYFFIQYSPGDPAWCGTYHSLHKINRNGTLVKRHATNSWPLIAFVSSRDKRIAAEKHNAQYATIEVVNDITTEHIKKHFAEESQNQAGLMKWEERNYGAVQEVTIACRDFYKMISEKL